MVCSSIRDETFRIIGFRRANKREEKTYAEAPLTDEDGEVRELTAEDFKDARPIADVHPELVEAMKAMRNLGGRPRVEAPRTHIGFRWAPDLVATIKAGGKGYNARIGQIVRQAQQDGKL